MIAEGRCEATRRDGTPCGARPLAASRFCFSHDPARATEREAAQAVGVVRGREGRAARRLGRLPFRTRCPRCASRDAERNGEPPKPWACRVCGYHF